jgi:hypothetical protein
MFTRFIDATLFFFVLVAGMAGVIGVLAGFVYLVSHESPYWAAALLLVGLPITLGVSSTAMDYVA